MVQTYQETDNFVYQNIPQNSDTRLIFLSGLGTPIKLQREECFRRFALLNGISYLALDYTKYALQYKASEKFQIPTFIPKTQKLLEKLPEKNFLIFGACFGGLIGTEMAQKMPSKVSGIVVTSPPYECAEKPWIKDADNFLHLRMQQKSKDKNISLAQLRKLAILHLLFSSCYDNVFKTPLSNDYQGPMTILHGEKDPLIPAENSRYIGQLLSNPNLKVQIVPHMKHTMAFDKEMKHPLTILKQYMDRIKSHQ